jgi:hypothetical protein
MAGDERVTYHITTLCAYHGRTGYDTNDIYPAREQSDMKHERGNYCISALIGDDTSVLVWFTYYPGRAGRTSGPIDLCYPEEPEEVTIYGVAIDGDDIQECLNQDTIDDLEGTIWDQKENWRSAAWGR